MIKDWFEDFKLNGEGNYNDFIQKYFGQKKFYAEITKHLDNKSEIPVLCKHLYKMATLNNSAINISILDILPIFLKKLCLLTYHHSNSKKLIQDNVYPLRTTLISILNLLKFSVKSESIRIDAYCKGSIYHKTIARPDVELLNLDQEVIESETTLDDPADPVLLLGLIKLYVYHLHEFSAASLGDFCQLCICVSSLTTSPRIPVTCDMLQQLLTGVYFVLFKERLVDCAIRAIDAIEQRATFELMAPVMLMIVSIQNSLCYNPSGHPFEGPIGISTFIKERCDTQNHDNVITNANFKPHKMPDDITQVQGVIVRSVNGVGDPKNAARRTSNNNNINGDGAITTSKKVALGPEDIELKVTISAPGKSTKFRVTRQDTENAEIISNM